ncbi:phage tail tape measure protein, partial [Desulfocurvibacter africanus]|uniref:phage tail tape measure protein n=1 Tax=Desulfocurvibacter africanus TaxID=873 RepID=UPI002FDA493B
NTAAKAPEMLEVLQRVGGTAKTFGLSATQAAALGNAFVALGKTPEVASTGINAMLNRLMTADKQGKEFQGSLKQLGWTAKSLKQAIGEDAQGGLDKFLESLASVDESKRMGILTGLFGMEFADDISVLVGSLDQYRKAQNLVGQETQYAGSMQREFESRAATSEAKVRLLGNVVTTLGINLGTVLLPGINYVVGALANVVGWVADFAERNETLTRIVGGLAAGILGVGIASFILGYAWTFVQGGALLVAKSVMFIGRAFQIMGMAMAGNPIGLVLAGLALAAGLVIANWDSVKKWLGKAWDWIVEKAGWVGEKVKKYLGWLFDEQEGGELGVAVADGPEALEAPELAQVPQLGA